MVSERVDDGYSGSNFERPSFQLMMEDIKKGIVDCIVVKDLSRFENMMQGQPYSISEFCDDEYSGTGFERPGLKVMLEATKAGKINAVVVKDFSRFGRDYLEVGRYLEFIFPVMQIRFISVNDSYDSEDQAGATGGMGMALKNLVYSMYSRDLSKKVRTAKHTRVRNGEFIASFAPYGYRKDPEDNHKLLADGEVAWVVQKIFQMAADGRKVSEIARCLNEMEIPTRYQYHKSIGDNFPCVYNHTGESKVLIKNKKR